MTNSSQPPVTVEDYIAAAPAAVQPVLRRIRSTVRKAVPQATERLSYRMPTFFAEGVVLHYAAFRSHIGLYPPVQGDADLEAAVAPYAGAKGNLRFPLDQPMPYALIARIARHRAQQNLARLASKPKSARKSALKRGRTSHQS